jgi:hypothetical protein
MEKTQREAPYRYFYTARGEMQEVCDMADLQEIVQQVVKKSTFRSGQGR